MNKLFRTNKWLLFGLGFSSLVSCSSLPPQEDLDVYVPDEPALSLRADIPALNSWMIQLDSYTNRLASIKASGFQMAVVDYSSDGTNPGKWTRTEVKDAKSNKQLLAYISVAQAEDYRYYWSSSYKVGSPSWITAASPSYSGQYLIDYSSSEWQSIILGYVAKIIYQGFDGAYLDNVNVYNNLGATALAKTQMVNWICKISQYAKAKNPNFKILTQNASDLIWVNNGALAGCIDATAQESTWFKATDARTLEANRVQQLKDYTEFKRLGKPVFALDFAKTTSNIAEAYTKSKANGLIEYVTDANLDVLRINAGFDPAPGTTPTPPPTPTPTSSADLGLSVNPVPNPAVVNANLSYTFNIKNVGPNAATNLKFTDTIPANAKYVSSNPSQGTCSVSGNVLTCALGSLALNASAQMTVVLNSSVAGTLVNTASVSASEVDPVTTNNASSVITTVQSAPTTTPPPAPTPGTIKLPLIGKISWDWQIGASGDSNVTVPSGVTLLDLDGFNISAAKVASLKAQGIYTVCYIDAGSYEDGRPDSSQYPAYLKIYKDTQWNEWFLDIRDVFKPNSVLAQLLTARFQMCKDKGFDALEPDNLQNDENTKGLLTKQEQIDFNGWVADTAHSVGLAVFQKNGPDNILLKDRTGKMMVDKFDGILNEECQQYSECNPLAEYVKRGKLALNTEYSQTLDCTTSNSLVINSIKKDLGLTGGNMSGYTRQSCN
jgi:uncharacterized protein (TIGR01370 family)